MRNFEKVLPVAEEQGSEHFDMRESEVLTHKHKCGTVHCAAGWYAVSRKDSEGWRYALKRWNEIEYLDGGRWMAEDLGLGDIIDLERWAGKNPEIWGNCHGKGMFQKALAYGDGEETFAESLRDVYEHWVRVRGRLVEKMTVKKEERLK